MRFRGYREEEEKKKEHAVVPLVEYDFRILESEVSCQHEQQMTVGRAGARLSLL